MTRRHEKALTHARTSTAQRTQPAHPIVYEKLGADLREERQTGGLIYKSMLMKNTLSGSQRGPSYRYDYCLLLYREAGPTDV